MSDLTPTEVCILISEWADAATVSTADSRGHNNQTGHITVMKSCLLSRMVYSREHPSKTQCPVHLGKWSGIHNWSGNGLVVIGGVSEGYETFRPVEGMLKDWYDAGCRCFLHKGCNCTTGWQPDAACGCVKEEVR